MGSLAFAFGFGFGGSFFFGGGFTGATPSESDLSLTGTFLVRFLGGMTLDESTAFRLPLPLSTVPTCSTSSSSGSVEGVVCVFFGLARGRFAGAASGTAAALPLPFFGGTTSSTSSSVAPPNSTGLSCGERNASTTCTSESSGASAFFLIVGLS